MTIYRNHANLVSLWTFEDSADLGNDAVGSNDMSNNNSTVVGAEYLCKQGFYAADFEAGSSQRLNITDASQSGLDITGAMTVTAWVRFESLTGSTGEGPTLCGKYTASGNQRSWMLWAYNNGTNFKLRGLVSSNGTAETTITGGTTLATGTWYHVALVYDGSNLRLYLNGEEDATAVSYSSGIFNSTSRFEIGNRGDATASYFMDGLIDEVAVFNDDLSEADINDIMSFGVLAVPVTYYVSAAGSDAAAGTSTGTAWQTTARVNTGFTNGEFNPGDQILFRRGDSFSVNSSSRQIVLRNCTGTEAYPITIGAYGTGARPYLNDASGGDRECFVQYLPPSTGWERRANYVVIQDLAIGQFDALTQSNEAIRLTGSHHITIKNCYFNDIQTASVSTLTIVAVQSGTDCHHIFISNNVAKDVGGEVFYYSRVATTVPTFHWHIGRIIGNTVIDCDGEAVDLKGNSDYVHIVRNFIEGCGSYGTSQIKVGGRYHRIWRNHVTRQRGSCIAGIELEYTADGAAFGCMFSIAERNFVSGMTGNSGGIELNGSANTVRNNTIVSCTRGLFISEQGWDATQQKALNNLFASNTYDVYQNGGTLSDFNINYNNYSNKTSSVWFWSGAARTFSYVQGTLGQEAQGLTDDADVENTGLYVLKSTSPLIDIGTDSSGYDYEGGGYDIGWWEYNHRNFATFEHLFDNLNDLTVSGAASISAAARHRDANGLLATVSTTPANVTASIISSDRAFFRFYLNLDNVTASTGDKFKIFQGLNASSQEVNAVEIKKMASGWRVRGSITGDSGTAQVTPWISLSSEWNCVELWWLREYEDSQAWGEIALYVNAGTGGIPSAAIADVNNDTRGNCGSVVLGTIGTIPASCSGSLYLAALTINQLEYIGPHGPVRENDPDLQGLWRFDDSAALGTDTSANVNTLSQSSVVFTGSAYFSIGAVDFEAGSSSFMYRNHADQIGLDLTPPFSIMLYAKFESDGVTSGILSKEQAGGANLAYELRRMTDGRLRLTLSSDGSSTFTFDSDNPLYSGVWYHIAVVANGTDIRFYINGILDSASPGAWTAALNASDGTFRIGRAGSDYLDGVTDDIAIFSRALEADEVWWSHRSSVSGTGNFLSFPTTPILDNFNRANEGPPATGWTTIANGVEVISNELAGDTESASGTSLWSGGSFNAYQEVYCTITAQGAEEGPALYFRSASDLSTYCYLRVRPTAIPNTHWFQLIDSSGGGTLFYDENLTFNVGDSVGLRAFNTTVEVYRKPAGGSWGLIFTSTVSIVAAGYIGTSLSDTARIDDFGGGNVTTSIIPSVSDNITLGETAAVNMVSRPSVSDGVTLGESTAAWLVSDISVSDGLTLGETTAVTVSVLQVNVNDGLTLGETALATIVSSGEIALSVLDSLVVGEVVTVALSNLAISGLSDGVTLSDSVTVALGAPPVVDVSDDVTVGEAVVITLDTLTVSVSDGVTLGDTPTAAVSTAVISVSDGVTVGENWTVSFITVGVTDAVTVGESAVVVTLSPPLLSTATRPTLATFHRSQELSLIIEDPLYYTTRSFTRRITPLVSRYNHEIRALGGFWSASLSINDSQKKIEDWIAYGLGRHLVLYNNSLVPAWEGFVNKITATLGPFQYEVGPLLDAGNRVVVTYSIEDATVSPPLVGARGNTSTANNTDSQARYGVIQKFYSVNGVRSVAEAEQIRDSYVNDPKYAYPATSRQSNLSGGNEPAVTLECLGYWHWLRAYYPTSSVTGYIVANTKIQNVLTANPNAMFATDYAMIAANATLVKEQISGEQTAEEILKSINSLGDSSLNVYSMGFYQNRQMIYQPVNRAVEYQQRIASNKGLVNAVNREIKPWDARAGRYILFPDFLIGQFPPATAITLGSDPRVGYVETARFTAPWGLSLDGKKMSQLDQVLARKGMGGLG